MILYIDIILLENVVMNYIIILATGMICRVNIKQIRVFLASLLGAIYAIVIYILDLRIYTNQLTKLIISISMVYIAFNSGNIKTMIKQRGAIPPRGKCRRKWNVKN